MRGEGVGVEDQMIASTSKLEGMEQVKGLVVYSGLKRGGCLGFRGWGGGPNESVH